MGFESQNHLLAPGPVAIPEEILQVLSRPMIHHRTPEFTKILTRVLEQLKNIFVTEQPVMLLSSTGTGAMQAALTNTLSSEDEILVVESGKFGERWSKIAKSFGVTVHTLEVEWGKSVVTKDIEVLLRKHPKIKAICTQACETSTATSHPIKEIASLTKNDPNRILIVDAITALIYQELPMDDWGIDVLVAGSQKAFMLPAGLSMIALSEKAWAFSTHSTLPKFYFDLQAELNANQKGQTHFSSAVTHIRALDAILDQFEKIGLQKVIAQAKKIQQAIISACQEFQLSIFATCPTVTAIKVPNDLDGTQIRDHMELDFNVTVMGGQDQLKGKILRIGHMGYIKESDLIVCFEALAKGLNDHNFIVSQDQIENAKQKIQESFSQ